MKLCVLDQHQINMFGKLCVPCGSQVAIPLDIVYYTCVLGGYLILLSEL